MKHVKTKGTAYVLAALMACALLATGCSNIMPANSSDEQGTASEARTLSVVGDQANASKAIVLENRLGGEIAKVSINVSDSKDEPTLLSAGGAWAEGTSALIFIPAANAESRSDFVLTVNDKDYVLHEIDFSNIQTGEVCLDGKIAYISYAMGGKKVSTLEHEKDLISRAKAVKKAQKAKEEAEKKAKEEAEKAAAEEKARAEAEAAAAAQAQAEAEAAAAQQWVEQPAENYYYEQPAYDQQYVEQQYVEQPYVEGQYVEQTYTE